MQVGDRVQYPGLEEGEVYEGVITYANPDGTVCVAWDDGFDDGENNTFLPEELTGT